MMEKMLLQNQSCNTMMHKLIDVLYMTIENSPLGRDKEYLDLGDYLLERLDRHDFTTWNGTMEDNYADIDWLLTATQKAADLALLQHFKIADEEQQLKETFDQTCEWLKTTICEFTRF